MMMIASEQPYPVSYNTPSLQELIAGFGGAHRPSSGKGIRE